MSTGNNAPSVPSRRVLLVDDRRDAIFPLQMLLKLMKHEVATAANGKQALEVAVEFVPDTVLCDISLGLGMNGYEVAKALREQPQFRDAYLVAVSGYDDEDDRQAAREAGFDFHVTKPVSKDTLDRLMGERPTFETEG
jgi:two-component system OmpR family response regulator